MALSIGFRIFSFLPSCYSSYGALNFYPDGTFTHCSCQPSLDAHFSFLIRLTRNCRRSGHDRPGVFKRIILETQMDFSERLARDYFVHLGFTRIDYEPEGCSKPPDFLLNARIAVEVRRLNQIETPSQAAGRPRGLEEIAIPLWNTVQDLLPSFGPPTAQVSWYVFIRYSRPVPSKGDLSAAIRQHLTKFRDQPRTEVTLRLFDNFMIRMSPAGHACADLFVMGGATDRDAGGWVIPELERNVQICINEKSAKISMIR
jgi:hypothetical protein